MLEQTNTGYMYDLAIDFIMCNIVPDSEFVLACMVIIVMQHLMNKTNTAVLIISYSTDQSYSMEDNKFFKECI